MATAEEFLQNPAWIERLEEAFVRLDTKKNGYLTLEDWELWVDNIDREIKPAPHSVAALRDRTVEYCAAIGIVRGSRFTKEQFIKKFAALAVVERGKKLRGEETILHKVNNAWFDVVDTNHDGHVTFDQCRAIMKACNQLYDPSTADELLESIDKNKNGKIERADLIDTEFKFWFTLDDDDDAD